MTLLLVSLRTDRPDLVPGHVSDVQPDDHIPSPRNARGQATVRTDKKIEECRAIFFESGVTPAAKAELDAARAALAAERQAGKVTKATMDRMSAAEAAVAACPQRKVRIDPAALPPDVVSRVQATWGVILAKQPDLAAEVKTRVVSLMETKLGRQLTPQEVAKDPGEWRAAAVAAADAVVAAATPGDIASTLAAEAAAEPFEQTATEIDSIRHAAETDVVQTAIELLDRPDEVVMDAAALDAATVPYG